MCLCGRSFVHFHFAPHTPLWEADIRGCHPRVRLRSRGSRVAIKPGPSLENSHCSLHIITNHGSEVSHTNPLRGTVQGWTGGHHQRKASQMLGHFRLRILRFGAQIQTSLKARFFLLLPFVFGQGQTADAIQLRVQARPPLFPGEWGTTSREALQRT